MVGGRGGAHTRLEVGLCSRSWDLVWGRNSGCWPGCVCVGQQHPPRVSRETMRQSACAMTFEFWGGGLMCRVKGVEVHIQISHRVGSGADSDIDLDISLSRLHAATHMVFQ